MKCFLQMQALPQFQLANAEMDGIMILHTATVLFRRYSITVNAKLLHDSSKPYTQFLDSHGIDVTRSYQKSLKYLHLEIIRTKSKEPSKIFLLVAPVL